jgi:hypothetical protein
VAVAARADVALRIERLAAQRARKPARRDDRQGAVHEAPGVLGREPDAERVRPVVIVVRRPLEGREELARRRPGDPLDGREVDDRLALVLFLVVVLRRIVVVLVVVRLGARLDEDLLGVAVPAEGQRRRPERLVQGLLEGRRVGGPGVGRGRDRSARTATWTFSRITDTI